jgi:hypothetical protein
MEKAASFVEKGGPNGSDCPTAGGEPIKKKRARKKWKKPPKTSQIALFQPTTSSFRQRAEQACWAIPQKLKTRTGLRSACTARLMERPALPKWPGSLVKGVEDSSLGREETIREADGERKEALRLGTGNVEGGTQVEE